MREFIVGEHDIGGFVRQIEIQWYGIRSSGDIDTTMPEASTPRWWTFLRTQTADSYLETAGRNHDPTFKVPNGQRKTGLDWPVQSKVKSGQMVEIGLRKQS